MSDKDKLLAWFRHELSSAEEAGFASFFMRGNPLVRGLRVPICERGTGRTGYDVFGVHWTTAIEASHCTPGQKPIYDDIADWRDQVRIPRAERFDWEPLIRQADAVDRDKQMTVVTLLMGPFERTSCLTTFEDCLVNAITDPDDFSDLIGAIADYKITLIDKIWSIAQPDLYTLHDDWGTAQSTFMSPELWRRTIKPHIQRMYNAVKAHGALISQHSCGKITPLVGDMVEMGCNALECQLDLNDPVALEARFGDRLRIIRRPPEDFVAPAETNEIFMPLVGGEPTYDTVPVWLYE
jgi:hypothetical protein